jgi:DNA primase
LLRLPPGRISSRLQGSRAAPNPPPRAQVPQPAPARPISELPRSQVALVALLVDNPHLAFEAEQAGVQLYVTDPRLQPIAEEVLRRAQVGENPPEGELLELVDPAARRQVHDAVFAGTFRDTQEDPLALLRGCIWDCQRDRLKAERRRLDTQLAEARERGELDRARELSQLKVELIRHLADLEQSPPDFSSSAASRP